LPVAEDVLARQFTPTAPHQVWVNDITYVPPAKAGSVSPPAWISPSGAWLWAMSERIDRMLACDALTDALRRRRPAPGVLHHSDRGSQYAGADYQRLSQQQGMLPSMSHKGNCWDNAPMASFAHSLKVEWLHDQTLRTLAEAWQAIFTDIEVCYHRQRLHSALGYRSPETDERLIAA
jgi:transposase InsO family protein